MLVVSPANAERRQLNAAIREALTRRPRRWQGIDQTILVSRELTRPQRRQAHSYEIGDVIRFTRGSKKMALDKGSYASIEAVDRETNRLVARPPMANASRTIRAGSLVWKFSAKSNVSSPRAIGFSSALPDRALGIANGEFASVVAIDDRKALLRLDGGREVAPRAETPPHRLRLRLDLALKPGRHGRSRHRKRRHHRSPELVNRKQFYVSISRARNALTLFTDNRTQLGHAVNRNREKSVAFEHQVRTAPHAYKILPDEQRRTVNRSYGVRR